MIECVEVEWKPSKSRLFAGGAGLQFYVSAPTAGIVDKLANVVMNKAIEINGTMRGVTLQRRAPRTVKVAPQQLKLL